MPVARTPEQLINLPARRLPPARLRGGRLMKAAAAGDPAAFEEIYRRHHQEIYRYCLGILRNGADAEDALQATMAAAMRALPGEVREIALRAWLFRVAHNESVSLLRSRRGDVAEEDVVLMSPQSTTQRVEEREAMGTLLADLAELPERQRGALLMRELSGLSFAEIGAALGCSDVAARQTLFAARVALKEADEGRAMSCEEVQGILSDGDRRKLRGRKLKAHIAGCEDCQDFKTAIDVRKDRLQVLCPPLAAVAASSLLAGLAGGGSGVTAAGTAAGAGVGAGAGVAGASGATSAAAGALGAGAVVKGASVAAAVAIAAGAADVAGVIDAPGPLDISGTAQTSDALEGGSTSTVPTNGAADKPGSAQAQEARARGVEASGAKGANGKGKGGRPADGGRGKGKGKGGSNKGEKGQSQSGQGKTGGGKPSGTPGGGNAGGNGTPAAPPANAGAGAGGGSGNAGGGSGSSPGSQAPASGGSGGGNGHAGGGPAAGGPPEHAAGNGPKS